MQLHGSLQDLRQGDDTVTLYLQCAKGLFDELVAAGRPISLTDFNLYVFRGLRGEFRDLVTSLSTKVDPLSYSELHSHLSTHEFIHRSSVSSSLTTAPLRSPPQYILPSVVFLGQTAVVSWLIGVEDDGVAGGILTATFLSQSFRGASGGSPWQQPRSHSRQWQNHPHRGAATNQWPRQQIKCQLCHIYGHSAQ
jgi:hypothetical protein